MIDTGTIMLILFIIGIGGVAFLWSLTKVGERFNNRKYTADDWDEIEQRKAGINDD